MGGVWEVFIGKEGGWKRYLFTYLFIVEESVKIFKVVDNETWDIKWERSREVLLRWHCLGKNVRKGF